MPPKWAVDALLARGDWPAIRALEGIIEAPTIRPDGSMIESPGWDRATGLLYSPNAEFPTTAKAPTPEDAKLAAAELLDLVGDFPFVDDRHKVVWLAALLTPMARWAIDGPTPLFLFDANCPGSGKSKLCDLIALVATGRPMARSSYPAKDEEMGKILTTIALAGDRMTLFDNLKTGGALGSPALDLAITSTTLKGRILGKSESTGELPWRTVLYATGNNLGMAGDALRRVVPCRLESAEVRPEERRDFRVEDLEGHVLRERPRLVRAALTILRAHAIAGRPEPPDMPSMDFRSWSKNIRSAVAWSTGIDPCDPGRCERGGRRDG